MILRPAVAPARSRALEGPLRLFEFLRRRPSIRDPEALADFIDQRAAFLVQKGIYEYSRARAGHYAKVLFREAAFLEAVEQSRWCAYPLGLAMVGEVAEGVLRPYFHADRARGVEAMREFILTVFDRYQSSAQVGEPFWREARAELSRRLELIGLHSVKRVIDIPETYVQAYFDLMPIHEQLRGQDFPTIHNYLKVVLCNVHDELTKKVDAPQLARALLADASARSQHETGGPDAPQQG
jgi:hypothetical protein